MHDFFLLYHVFCCYCVLRRDWQGHLADVPDEADEWHKIMFTDEGMRAFRDQDWLQHSVAAAVLRRLLYTSPKASVQRLPGKAAVRTVFLRVC
jgi:hypothetical protein